MFRLLSLVGLLCTVSNAKVTGTALLDAAAHGNLMEVKSILAQDQALATFASTDGETPLHVSCISGDAKIVRALLQSGALVDARASGPKSLKMTPLSWCVYGGFKEAVEALVAGGADVNAVFLDEVGKKITVLDVCESIGKERRDIAAVLRGAGAVKFEQLDPDHGSEF